MYILWDNSPQTSTFPKTTSSENLQPKHRQDQLQLHEQHETACNHQKFTKPLLHAKTTTRQKRTSDSQRTTSKQDTETTPHHSFTLNTETPPNSASTSGTSKTTTSNTLFPGTFSYHTRRTTAQVKDEIFASKKNS